MVEFFSDEFLAFDIPFVFDLYLRLLDYLFVHSVFLDEFFQFRQDLLKRFETRIVAHQDVVQLATLCQRVRSDRFQIVVNFGCFDTQVTCKCYKRFYERFFLHEFCISFLRNQTDFVPERSEPQVGIVLSQQDAVFGARGEHAVGLVYSFGYQVVDQHSDVGFVAADHNGLLPCQCPVCIDSGHQTLCRRLFVPGRAIDLSGEVETCHPLGFERMVQLCGRKIVVFYGISRSVDVQIFESVDLMQRFPLHLPRQRRRKSVEVVFVCRAAFGLEEQLVLFLVGERAEFVFDRGTVARPYTPDRAVEQGRFSESAAQCLVHLGRGVDQIAGHLLLNGPDLRCERELGRFLVSVLGFEPGKVDRACIESCRGTGLHPPGFESHAAQ